MYIRMFVRMYPSLTFVCMCICTYMHMYVCVALLHTNIPTYVHISLPQALDLDRVVPLHIDTGFMRKEESKNVKKSLESIGVDLRGMH